MTLTTLTHVKDSENVNYYGNLREYEMTWCTLECYLGASFRKVIAQHENLYLMEHGIYLAIVEAVGNHIYVLDAYGVDGYRHNNEVIRAIWNHHTK